MESITNLVRAIPRPVLAIFLPISWVMFVFWTYKSGGTIADVPAVYTSFVGIVLAEYFGERAILHLKGKK